MKPREPTPLTVVIAARGGPEPATRALASLDGQQAAILVVYPKTEAYLAPPGVRAEPVGTDTFSGLRAEGLNLAQTPAVAIFSQDYTADSDWAVIASQPAEAEVVCGEVYPPDSGWTARAAYLWEYAHLAPPCRSGMLSAEESRLVPAGAVVYRGAAIDARRLQENASELDYHAQMAADGLRFYREPRLRLKYHPPGSLSQFRADRRRWSRDDARDRNGDRSIFQRLALAATRAALPPVLLIRFCRALSLKPCYWLSAMVSSPLLVLFAIDQMVGEIRGLLTDDS